MIKAIIFDVGGTLLGASDLFENILRDCKDDKALFYDELVNDFVRIINTCRNKEPFKKVQDIISEIIQNLNNKNDNCLSKVNAKDVYWKTFVNDSYVINHADKVLKQLHENNIELFVASDADAELIYKQFENQNWEKYFKKYFISSEIKAYKPANAFVNVLQEAIHEYNNDEVLFVGDSNVDIEMGKKLGIKTVLISKNKKNEYGEDYTFSNLLELVEIKE